MAFLRRCFELFGGSDEGLCPAGGGHIAAGFSFVLPSNQPETAVNQTAWRYCHKCAALFYNGFDTHGVCPAGGHHARMSANTDGTRADPKFVLDHDLAGGETPTAQRAWFFCRNCFVLFYGGFPARGVCPSGGGHDGVGSFDYMLDDVRSPARRTRTQQ